MKRLRDESGQVMVLTVLSMAVLIGFVAFAVDIGMLLRAKRVVQTAADSAAIAAAAELPYGDCYAAAQVDAGQNVATTGTYAATITASPSASSCTPTSGAFVNQPNYVQVTVSQPQPTFFIKAFEALVGNPQLGTMIVSASSTAMLAPDTTCIYTVSSTPPSGLGVSLTGGATLNMPTCGILDDAVGGNSISVTGGSLIDALSVGVVGDSVVATGGQIQPTAAVTGIAPVGDPLSYLTPPAIPPGCSTQPPTPTISTNTTLDPSTSSTPGTLCFNGLPISNGATVTLRPGVYIVYGNGPTGLSVNAGATITGSGVTFYLTHQAQFILSGNATPNLSAPLSGLYSGILFYQDPSDQTSVEISGGGGGSFNGIFYAPTALVFINNGGDLTFNSDFVVGSFWMNDTVNLQTYAPVGGTSPLQVPRLAE